MEFFERLGAKISMNCRTKTVLIEGELPIPGPHGQR